jgi:SAM-dependent methyltransferase
MTSDAWVHGDAYEAYVGRWSRVVATEFVRRLRPHAGRLAALPPAYLTVPAGRRWLDVGCGTGALTATVLAMAEPAEVVGVDPAEGFLATARDRITDPRASFRLGDARELPVADGSFDAVVSGLALNFVPQPDRAAAEIARVVAPGGVTAAYVWDYAGGMQMMAAFWMAAIAVDPAAAERDENPRFPICRPEPLTALWTGAGLTEVAVTPIDVPTVFRDFDDYWLPFLGGQGPAPAYVMSLSEESRSAVRDLLRERLPSAPDGSISLKARAWSVTGRRPD